MMRFYVRGLIDGLLSVEIITLNSHLKYVHNPTTKTGFIPENRNRADVAPPAGVGGLHPESAVLVLCV